MHGSEPEMGWSEEESQQTHLDYGAGGAVSEGHRPQKEGQVSGHEVRTLAGSCLPLSTGSKLLVARRTC